MMKGLTTSFNEFNTFANRSMIYWTRIMLWTSNIMINIECCIISRWATKFGYICRRSALLDTTTSFSHSDMGHTQSPRPLLTIPLSSASHHSLVCTQCSMWITFSHNFDIVGHVSHCGKSYTNRAQHRLHGTCHNESNHGHTNQEHF